jgi:hypothetical protein
MDKHIIMPAAGKIRPKTSSSGIFNTKRSKAVSVSMLTRILVPNPKKAFQSPGTQILGVVAFILLVSDLLRNWFGYLGVT